MTSKHICLVSPGHLATNPRLVKEADALVAAGYQVTVIASRFVEWADMADSEFNDRHWTVHRVAFGRLAGRWTHLAQRLRQELAALAHRWTGFGAAQAFHPVVPALTRATRAVTADLYIAHNLAALPAAAAAAKLHGARLGFDAEDFHRGEFLERAQPTRALKLTRVLEDRYIPRCDHLTAASPGIARAYAQACGVRAPSVVLNVFPLSQSLQSGSSSRATKPRPSLYWFSQTLGPNRGLETVVEALSLCKSRPNLFLRGAPAAGYLSQLKEKAKHLAISDLLQFLPPAAPSEMVALASAHDIGIASEPGHTPNNEIALSNKLFTFLLAGLPVVASATEAQTEIARSMAGAVFLYPKTSAAGLARQIDDLLLSPEALARAREAAWALGQQRFNWDVERKILTTAVKGALESRPMDPRNPQLKVLCISPRFAPVNAADSHRVRLVLPHLLAQSCHVEVLAVHPDDVAGPQDPELAARLPRDLHVHRVRAWNLSAWGLQGLAQRSFVPLYRKGCELLAKGDYDLVFFSTTEFLLHGLGPMWRKKYGIPFCMDLQDPWVNDYYRDNPHIRPPGGRLKYAVASKLHRLVEKAVAPRSSGFLSVSPAYLPMMERRHGASVARQPRLVAAFPGEPGEFADIAATEAPRTSSQGGVWRYVGRGGPDMARAASAFFLAWREAIDTGLLTEDQVRFEALGTSYASGAAASKTLEPLARQAGLSSHVTETPERLGYVEMLRTLQRSDALIVFGSDDPAYTASKIYPYLLSGKPLLCICHESSSVVSLMRSAGGGVCVEFSEQTNVETLVSAIRRAWFEPRRYESSVPLDPVAFEPHTARAQAAALAAWFNQMVAYGG